MLFSSPTYCYFRSFLVCLVFLISDIYGKEGLTGLWRGIMPTLVGILPSRYALMSLCRVLARKCNRAWPDFCVLLQGYLFLCVCDVQERADKVSVAPWIVPCSVVHVSDACCSRFRYGGEENSLVHMLAAVAAGTASLAPLSAVLFHWLPSLLFYVLLRTICVPGATVSTATNPIWVVKTRMQLQVNIRLLSFASLTYSPCCRRCFLVLLRFHVCMFTILSCLLALDCRTWCHGCVFKVGAASLLRFSCSLPWFLFSSWDCIVKTFKAERFGGFYKGCVLA
jgi:hypothetical protein